jgi:putative acetyltransferase
VTIVVRPERGHDHPAVRAIHARAFGREDEARLVDRLRGAVDPQVSLVALIDGRVVGHIFLAPVAIRGEGGETDAFALAPLGVDPDFQNRGVGSALVRAGLEAAGDLGERVIFVLGEPAFYGRFGFEPASGRGLRFPSPVPEEAFMVLELEAGALEGRRGEVIYPAAFSELSSAPPGAP